MTGADTLSILNNPAGLGYMSSRALGVTYRNLPESKTAITGDLGNPTQRTVGNRGSNSFTHFGYVLPASAIKRGTSGTVGVSYTTGGYINDTRTGTNLQNGSVTVNSYQEELKAQANFFTLSYGKTNEAQNVSFGYGLVFARQLITDTVDGTLANSLPFNKTDVSETGTGFGVVLGVQFIPKNQSNVSYGASLRTPIKLHNNSITSSIYDTIPGVLSLGTTWRMDGLKGGTDYLIYGAQLNTYFGGSGSAPLDRTSQTTFGFGAEYNFVKDNYTIPVRLGYLAVPKGGNGFGDRSAFTVGIGYRPTDKPYAIDLNYAYPRTGSSDVAINLSYRFDK